MIIFIGFSIYLLTGLLTLAFCTKGFRDKDFNKYRVMSKVKIFAFCPLLLPVLLSGVLIFGVREVYDRL